MSAFSGAGFLHSDILFILKMEQRFIAVEKGSQLLHGSSASRTAIVCLWTRREEVQKKVDSSMYSVMGQLYSAERGIDPLIRNLLANPWITNLVVTGRDISGSGRALMDFFRKGVSPASTRQGMKCWKIKSEIEAYIEPDLSKEQLDGLRGSVHIEMIPDPGKVRLFSEKQMPERKRIIAERKEPADARLLYAGVPVYVVREAQVKDAWAKILSIVMKFGLVSQTHFGSRQREVLDMVSVISDENPLRPEIPDNFPFTRRQFSLYAGRFMASAGIEGISYTYGNRMRCHFGKDQINEVVEKLASDPGTRQAVVDLWDSGKDIESSESPCLSHIWLRLREGRLHMSASLRSNDMYRAYPENALALRVLQERIRSMLSSRMRASGKKSRLQLGELVIISHSAHIYEENWEEALRAAEAASGRLLEKELNTDHMGSFYITADPMKRLINVDYLSSSGERLASFTGSSAEELRKKLAGEHVIGTPSHGLYLGLELARAELCIANRLQYQQDSGIRELRVESR